MLASTWMLTLLCGPTTGELLSAASQHFARSETFFAKCQPSQSVSQSSAVSISRSSRLWWCLRVTLAGLHRQLQVPVSAKRCRSGTADQFASRRHT